MTVNYRNVYVRLVIVVSMAFLCFNASAQVDSTSKSKLANRKLLAPDTTHAKIDSNIYRNAEKMSSESMRILADTPTTKEKAKPPYLQHDPKKATIRSLILPGWGQAYNKDYWKIPIVWGALAIPTATFLFNNSEYKKSKFAYDAVFEGYAKTPAEDRNTDNIQKMDSYYLNVWNKLYAQSPSSATSQFLSSVSNSRNYYRRNMDYSVLWFLILWGVNVADATVFGHLKGFDISSDLSIKMSPTYLQYAKTPGVKIVFDLK